MIGSRARFRRQYGVAGCTPCRTVAIYKPARLLSIPTPTLRQWFVYYASVGTDYEFAFWLASLVMSSYENKCNKLLMAARPMKYLYLTLRKFFC